MRPIRNIKSIARNLKDWLPVIIKDEHWDYEFIYDILYKKLELQENFFRSDKVWAADALDRADEIKEVREALLRLRKNDYVNLSFDMEREEVKGLIDKEEELMDKDLDTVFLGLRKNIMNWWD